MRAVPWDGHAFTFRACPADGTIKAVITGFTIRFVQGLAASIFVQADTGLTGSVGLRTIHRLAGHALAVLTRFRAVAE